MKKLFAVMAISEDRIVAASNTKLNVWCNEPNGEIYVWKSEARAIRSCHLANVTNVQVQQNSSTVELPVPKATFFEVVEVNSTRWDALWVKAEELQEEQATKRVIKFREFSKKTSEESTERVIRELMRAMERELATIKRYHEEFISDETSSGEKLGAVKSIIHEVMNNSANRYAYDVAREGMKMAAAYGDDEGLMRVW